MMSSLENGLDIYVCARRRCESQYRKMLYFCMKYIMLTYIQAGIMFNSFVVVECLYLIHWKRCKNVGGGWNGKGKKRCVCVCLCVCVRE
ncbi:hypothetical protein INR49_018161, partial [Caranx melampygus]